MSVELLKEGHILVDLGPMHLKAMVYREGAPFTKGAEIAAEAALYHFTELAKVKNEAKLPITEYETTWQYPAVLRKMIEACRKTNTPTITPMAAVAGAIADFAADAAVQVGATKVLIDNGGDVAIRLARGENTRVGIKSRRDVADFDYVVELDVNSMVGGVATSGLGGRSFSLGIASAAMAASPSGAEADACATLIGNATFIDSPAIARRPAEEIDPDTDIKGNQVVVKVGTLTGAEIKMAIEQGLAEARRLGVIGALVAVKEEVAFFPEGFVKKKS